MDYGFVFISDIIVLILLTLVFKALFAALALFQIINIKIPIFQTRVLAF